MTTAKNLFKVPRGHKRTHFFTDVHYSTLGTRNLSHFFIISVCALLKSFSGGCTSTIIRQSTEFESELKRFFIE